MNEWLILCTRYINFSVREGKISTITYARKVVANKRTYASEWEGSHVFPNFVLTQKMNDPKLTKHSPFPFSTLHITAH